MKPTVVCRRWISLSCLWPCVMKFKIMFCLPWGNADTDGKIQTKKTNVSEITVVALFVLNASPCTLEDNTAASSVSSATCHHREKSLAQEALIAIPPQDTTRKHQHGRLFIAFITFTSKGARPRTCAGQEILCMSKIVPWMWNVCIADLVWRSFIMCRNT